MQLFFKIISFATAALFVFLFIQLQFNSESFVQGLGLQASVTASILCRRVSIFMLGLSILSALSFNLPHSKARQYICLSTAITLLGLACMSTTEFVRGTVNSSMLQAITFETILGISYLIIFIKKHLELIV